MGLFGTTIDRRNIDFIALFTVAGKWEFCHILSGISILTEDGGEARTVKAGDSFVLRPGFKGGWEVLETTRKEYVIKL